MHTVLQRCIPAGILLCLCTGPLGIAAAKKAPAANRNDAAPRQSGEAKAAQLVQQAQTELDARNYSAAYNSVVASMKASPTAEGLYILCRLAAAENKAIPTRDLCRRYMADPAHAEQAAIPHQTEVTATLNKRIDSAGEVAVFGSTGSLLYLDDRLVGALPLSRPLLVGAGQHRITLLENDHRQEWPVKVLANRTVEMRFEPESSAVLVTQLPAVLLILRTGKLAPALASKVQVAIDQAVQSAHFATLHESELVADKGGDLSKCLQQPSCVADLASRNNADYVLTAAVSEFREDKAQKLSAQLDFSFAESRVLAQAIRSDEVCKSCAVPQLTNLAADSVRTLLALWTGRARGELSVSVNPKTAEILLDGTAVGAGRFENTVRSGVYQVEVRQSGYLAQRTSALVEPGKSAQLPLTLVPKVPVYRLEPGPRPLWRLVTGGVVAGVGLGLLVYGISGIALDGSCAESGPTGVCRQAFGSRPAGIGFSVGGGVLAAVGAVLMALPGGARNVEVDGGGFRDPTAE